MSISSWQIFISFSLIIVVVSGVVVLRISIDCGRVQWAAANWIEPVSYWISMSSVWSAFSGGPAKKSFAGRAGGLERGREERKRARWHHHQAIINQICAGGASWRGSTNNGRAPVSRRDGEGVPLPGHSDGHLWRPLVGGPAKCSLSGPAVGSPHKSNQTNTQVIDCRRRRRI